MIGIVLLLVVGPKKLPDVAKDVGKGIKKIRHVSDQLRDSAEVDEIKRAVYGEPGHTPAWKRPVSEHLQELIEGRDDDAHPKHAYAPPAPRPPSAVTETHAPEAVETPAAEAHEPPEAPEPEDDGRPVPRPAGPAAAAAAAAAAAVPTTPETQDGPADGERTRPA